MVLNRGPASRFALLQASLLIFLLFLIPLVLSNRPAGTAQGILLFAILFFFPGYLLLTLLNRFPPALGLALSPIVGMVSITTAYDISLRASVAPIFPACLLLLSVAGMLILALQILRAPAPSLWTRSDDQTVLAGAVVALSVAPLFWRSGRFSHGEFVFYGPAGQDQLYHLTMLQRLLQHVPPDNFMFSGIRPTVYHYFDDLALALILRFQNALHLPATDVFDLYYRCYPIVVYFLIGALAYRIGRQLLGSARGGILSVSLLLGAGGLGWLFGVLRTAAHASQFAALRAALFSPWTSWDGVDSMLPLVHRPAHYNSLLICLAAINVLLRPERSRRDWMIAGLLLGLMAGFNFTLAATFGAATVLGSLLSLWQRRQNDARDLAWFAWFIFLGSLPVSSAMLFSGFHNPAPGFPFRGPNLEFPAAIWGALLGRILPLPLVAWAALILFPLFAYGVKLLGVGELARLDLGGDTYRAIALVFALTFAVSFVIGTFFPYQGLGGIAIVFLQPTLWILALFSLRPIHAWMERNRGSWRPIALWAMLGLTWAHALAAFNFSSMAAFDQDTAQVLQDIHRAAAPGDVVAYLPSDLIERPIWGSAEESTDFSVMAMTGLDGYFSSEAYSEYSAVPGLTARTPAEVFAQAQRLYQQRRDDVESFVNGALSPAPAARLAQDHVRWIVVLGAGSQRISSSTTPWRKTPKIAVYRLPPEP